MRATRERHRRPCRRKVVRQVLPPETGLAPQVQKQSHGQLTIKRPSRQQLGQEGALLGEARFPEQGGKDGDDIHVALYLNQLGLDRESIPIYLSGIIHEEHELFGLLGKYIRRVTNTPYYLEELTKIQMIRFMVLSEGSKCA